MSYRQYVPAVLAAMTVFLTHNAIAEAKSPGRQLAEAQALVQALSHGHGNVVRTFPGPSGLTGIVVESGPRKLVVWMTHDGQTLIPGMILAKDGKNLTQTAMVSQGVMPKPRSAGPIMMALASKAAGVSVGHKGPLLTVFVDPNCIYCHRIYGLLMPAIRAGKVHVRFIPVGFLKPDSAAKAAAILSASSPQKALAENEAKFDTAAEEGGIPPAHAPSLAIQKEVGENTHLLSETGTLATPTLVFCDKDGKPQILHGLPQGPIDGVLHNLSAPREGVCVQK